MAAPPTKKLNTVPSRDSMDLDLCTAALQSFGIERSRDSPSPETKWRGGSNNQPKDRNASRTTLLDWPTCYCNIQDTAIEIFKRFERQKANTEETIHTESTRVTNILPPPYTSPFEAYTAAKVSTLNMTEKWVASEKPAYDLVHIAPGHVFGPNELVEHPEEALLIG